MPTQFCVGFHAGRLEAVFIEGSDGEYEASARKRRSAETNNRNPISSLSRRFLVGVNAAETNFMKACRSVAKRHLVVGQAWQGHTCQTKWKRKPPRCRAKPPEQNDYDIFEGMGKGKFGVMLTTKDTREGEGGQGVSGQVDGDTDASLRSA